MNKPTLMARHRAAAAARIANVECDSVVLAVMICSCCCVAIRSCCASTNASTLPVSAANAAYRLAGAPGGKEQQDVLAPDRSLQGDRRYLVG
jgi:hypothetical protein